MTCPVPGCLRPKAHSAPLCVAHWVKVSFARRRHWREMSRLAAAARTPEERGYFDETIGATLSAAVAEIGEAEHAAAA